MATEPFRWQDLIPSIITTGGNIGAAYMGSRQAGRANDLAQQNSQRLFQLGEQEQQRRDQLQRLLMPLLLKNLGYRNPMGVLGMASQRPQPPGSQPSVGGPPDPHPRDNDAEGLSNYYQVPAMYRRE